MTTVNTDSTLNTDMTFNGKEPIFIQIAKYYEKLIVAGAYKYNDSLPSVREVALELIVNPNTVQRAFSMMVEDGYAISIPKKGYFVSYETNSTKQYLTLEDKLRELLQQGYTKEEIINMLETLQGRTQK